MRSKPQTKEELEEAVKQNDSIADTLRALGRKPTSGKYTWIKRYIAMYDIDTSHFTGKGWSKNSVRYNTDEIFAKDSRALRGRVRSLILKYNLIPYECAFCGNTGEWMGKQMALELDHINGVPNDHRLENLRFLCPNCHATTDTYCGRNIEKDRKKQAEHKRSGDSAKRKNTNPVIDILVRDKKRREQRQRNRQYHGNQCVDCGKQICDTAKYCEACAHKAQRKVLDRPSAVELARMISETNIYSVSRGFGVSYNAVVKWCKAYGIPHKTTEIRQWYAENK